MDPSLEWRKIKVFSMGGEMGCRSMVGKMLKLEMTLAEIEKALVAARDKDNPNAYLGGLIAKRRREDG